MNLDNLKRLASEKVQEWWIKPEQKHDEEDCIYFSKPRYPTDDTFHVTEAAHTEKLAQALSKMIEVVEIQREALLAVKLFCNDSQTTFDLANEALTRANDLIGGI